MLEFQMNFFKYEQSYKLLPLYLCGREVVTYIIYAGNVISTTLRENEHYAQY